MRTKTEATLAGLAGLAQQLLPPRCVLCGGPGQPPALDLCAGCMADLPPAGESPDGFVAVYEFAPPLDHLVHALKYHGRLAVGRVLGQLLLQSEAVGNLLAGVDGIVPVPLHPQRMAGRGFNQSAEIARWLVRPRERPLLLQALRRVRPTSPQVGLGGELRRLNLRGAFLASENVAGRRLALVDDVITTGGTVAEARAALEAQGAARVSVIAVARVSLREAPD